MDSRSGSTPQRLSKRRMGIRVRRKIPHILHLDHEKHIGFISLLFCKYQFFQMLDRTLAGRIRKTADAVFLQRHSLYLNEYPFSLRFHIEVKAGISIGCLRSHKRHIPEEMPSPDPFLDQTVWNLGVHIDHPLPFLHTDQIPFRLPVRICASLYIDRSARDKKFRTAPCIFHMYSLLPAIQLSVCDEPVGPLKEYRFFYPLISHALPSCFPSCFLSLSQLTVRHCIPLPPAAGGECRIVRRHCSISAQKKTSPLTKAGLSVLLTVLRSRMHPF